MGSPLPVIGIVAAYLLFVVKLGPEFMKDRKPLNIKPIMTCYNLYQAMFNFYIVVQVRIIIFTYGILHSFHLRCKTNVKIDSAEGVGKSFIWNEKSQICLP